MLKDYKRKLKVFCLYGEYTDRHKTEPISANFRPKQKNRSQIIFLYRIKYAKIHHTGPLRFQIVSLYFHILSLLVLSLFITLAVSFTPPFIIRPQHLSLCAKHRQLTGGTPPPPQHKLFTCIFVAGLFT
jgi:hypothetical protein